jgi:hypothetical protein
MDDELNFCSEHDCPYCNIETDECEYGNGCVLIEKFFVKRRGRSIALSSSNEKKVDF